MLNSFKFKCEIILMKKTVSIQKMSAIMPGSVMLLRLKMNPCVSENIAILSEGKKKCIFNVSQSIEFGFVNEFRR